ncbi:hypothetical protein [Geodermatophilus sp. CPCC 205761]
MIRPISSEDPSAGERPAADAPTLVQPAVGQPDADTGTQPVTGRR